MADDTTTTEDTTEAADEQPERDDTPDRSSSRKRSRKRSKKDKRPGGSRDTARGSRRARSLKPALEEMFTGVGGALTMVNTFDGQCVVAGAPELAKALDELAKQDPAVQKALEKLVAGSTWGQVITAVAAVAMPIAANHGILPPGMAYAGVGSKALRANPAMAEAVEQAVENAQADEPADEPAPAA